MQCFYFGTCSARNATANARKHITRYAPEQQRTLSHVIRLGACARAHTPLRLPSKQKIPTGCPCMMLSPLGTDLFSSDHGQNAHTLIKSRQRAKEIFLSAPNKSFYLIHPTNERAMALEQFECKQTKSRKNTHTHIAINRTERVLGVAVDQCCVLCVHGTRAL